MTDPWSNVKPPSPWSAPAAPQSVAAIAAVTDNPLHQMYGHMDKDTLLLEWQKSKDAIEVAKEAEMNMRKYIVQRAFPEKKEGMNTMELGNGYQLKAAVKYNYNLAENKIVEACLDKIEKIGNQGAFIAERLVSWKPSFLLTEYRELERSAKEDKDPTAIKILEVVSEMLTVSEAAPTLDIKAPKEKKK